jgi:hypothetical protein
VHRLEEDLGCAGGLVAEEDPGHEGVLGPVEVLGCEGDLELEVVPEMEEVLERVEDFEHVAAQAGSEQMEVLRKGCVVVPVSVEDVDRTEERAGVLDELE